MMRIFHLLPVLLLAMLGACPEAVMAHGSVHARLAAVERRLATSPGDAALLLQRARLHHEHGDAAKALEDLRRVGRLDPGVLDRWLLATRIHLDAGDLDKALAAVQGILDKRPDTVAALSLRSEIREKNGEGRLAIRDFRRVVAVAQEPAVHHHLRLIRLLERHGSREEVAAAFAAARRAAGPFPVLLQRQAQWLATQGDRRGVASVYAELRDQVPGLAFAIHVEEVRLWHGHDAKRALLARDAAEQAWSTLSPAIRSRPAMIDKHRELQRLGPSDSP